LQNLQVIIDDDPSVAEVHNNRDLAEQGLLDAHNLNDIAQFVHRLGYVVRGLHILFHDGVLKLQIFESLEHLLNFSTDFVCLFVFKLFNCVGNPAEVLS
jgi:hypothetical protein